MKKALSIFSAEVSVFSHSTEDEKKVQHALLNTLPQELRGAVKVSSETVRGHYNDKITVLRVKLRREAQRFAQYLLSHFLPTDRVRLLEELDSRMDSSGNLYIRLNKQEAFLGNMELDESDPIWIKLKFKSSTKIISIFSVREVLSTLLDAAQGSLEGEKS